MICPNCGKEAARGTKFCSNCGLNLPGESEKPSQAWGWEPTRPPEPEQPQNKDEYWSPAGFDQATTYCQRCDKPVAAGQTHCADCARAINPRGAAPYRGVSRSLPVYAGFWWRFLAVFVDGFIIRIWGYILYRAFGMHPSDPYIADHPNFWPVAIFEIISIWLYHSLMESSAAQGSLGKMAVGLKVTDLDGNRVSFAQATGRHFGKFISALILCIGFLMAGFTEKKQTLHDMMAGTLVLKKRG